MGSQPPPPTAPASQTPRRKRKEPKKKKDKKKKKKTDRFHIRAELIFFLGQSALEAQICAMWGFFDVTTIPPKPDDGMKERFSQRYTSFDDFSKVLGKMPEQSFSLKAEIIKLRKRLEDSKRLGQVITKIEDNVLSIIALNLAHYHLDAWCPDLSQDATLDWNQIHHAICLDIFRQAVIAGGYAEWAVDQKYMSFENLGLLAKLYDNYIFSWIRSQV
ncbi:hypothetical protein E1B28_006838 [Marasmius oreades]|uniref:Uncharacterized protein n=1 Tax=Marasmius oreades TaxID=181124 RepID=A0A9P8ABL6_9AGAR|nr:uncharacterized protein E1B28_006838 [Marasmius oreades]KAG7096165.1 hypothetical protein E1B28_006838 [Marasmius oreades]